MSDPDVRQALVSRANYSFLLLAQQVQNMLDVVDTFQLRHPPIDNSLRLTHRQLEACIQTLGSVPTMLADVLNQAQAGKSRLLSIEGVEAELLNELAATLEALTMFFIQQHEPLSIYNHRLAKKALEMLRTTNRQLV